MDLNDMSMKFIVDDTEVRLRTYEVPMEGGVLEPMWYSELVKLPKEDNMELRVSRAVWPAMLERAATRCTAGGIVADLSVQPEDGLLRCLWTLLRCATASTQLDIGFSFGGNHAAQLLTSGLPYVTLAMPQRTLSRLLEAYPEAAEVPYGANQPSFWQAAYRDHEIGPMLPSEFSLLCACAEYFEKRANSRIDVYGDLGYGTVF